MRPARAVYPWRWRIEQAQAASSAPPVQARLRVYSFWSFLVDAGLKVPADLTSNLDRVARGFDKSSGWSGRRSGGGSGDRAPSLEKAKREIKPSLQLCIG